MSGWAVIREKRILWFASGFALLLPVSGYSEAKQRMVPETDVNASGNALESVLLTLSRPAASEQFMRDYLVGLKR